MAHRPRAMLAAVGVSTCLTGCAGLAAPSPEALAGKRLQSAIDSAQASAVISVAPGTYSTPLRITKPLVLRGEDASRCVFDVKANEPAVHVWNAGRVSLEDLTVRWSLASTRSRPSMPAAVAVENTEATLTNCRIQAMGSGKRAPQALAATGRSTVRFASGQCDGFEFTVMFVDQTEGEIVDSVFRNAGHCAITLHRGSRATISRNVICGSGYHGVRSSGGHLDLTDNLLADNRVSGAYLGNKNAHGIVRNNAFVGNGQGIASYYRSDVTIEHNLFVGSKYAGIGTWDSCPLTIRRNSFVQNGSGVTRYVGKTKLSPARLVLDSNHYWQNEKDTVECEKSATAITGDPAFVSQKEGDFTSSPSSALLDDEGRSQAGLVQAEPIRELWQRWKHAEGE